jgi:predicted nucleotidyltransferase
VDDALIGDIVRALVERFHPRRVLLFGSRARGTHRPDSDIDLFVEMPTNRRPPERCEDVLALFGLRPWSLDVVVYTPEEVERLRGQQGTLLSVIEAEGRVLHAGA